MNNGLPGWLKHATIWLLLALGLFLAAQAWLRHEARTEVTLAGGEIRIERGRDRHFHWPGTVNGRALEFLVDTGASSTSIPSELALELRLPVVGRVTANTAGGVTQGDLVLADLVLDGGVRVERLRITALPRLSTPLLGMDVLNRLRWQQDGGVLRVQAPAR